MNPIQEVVWRLGTREALAERMGVTRQAVDRWAKRGIVPANRVIEFSKEFGVAPCLLNPAFEGITQKAVKRVKNP